MQIAWAVLLLPLIGQGAYEDNRHHFAVVPPRGWESRPVRSGDGPVIARWEKVGTELRDRTRSPEISVRRVMAGWPTPMEELKQTVQEHFKAKYGEGYTELWSRDETIDGLPAFLTATGVKVTTAAEGGQEASSVKRLEIHGIIQRTLLEQFFVDLVAPVEEAHTYTRIFEEVIHSFRSREVEPSAEERSDLRRFNDLSDRWAEHRDALVVDDWFSIFAFPERGLELKIGSYHVLARVADVRGRPGIAFETRMDMVNRKEERAVTATRGAFRLDLSHQEDGFEETFVDPQGNTTRRHEMSASTAPNGFDVTR